MAVNNTMDTLSTLTVSGKTLGKILNVTDRRIRQYAEEGVIEKASRGKYMLLPSIQKYIASLKANNEADQMHEQQGELNYDDEHAKHEVIKRKIAEIQLAKIQGEVHAAEDVRIVMENMLSNFKARLLGVPSKMAPSLLARNEINVIQNLLEGELNEVLEELADYDPAVFLSEDYIELDDEEDEDYELDEEDTEEDD